MKKVVRILAIILSCALLLTGCGTFSKGNQEHPLAIYSFSGEDGLISVSNGVIVIDPAQEILYGGELKTKNEGFTDIVSYPITIYLISEYKERTLMSNSVEDTTGGIVDISGNIGKIAVDIFRNDDIDKFANNLWLELNTVNLDGESNTHQLQLKVTEITKTNAT